MCLEGFILSCSKLHWDILFTLLACICVRTIQALYIIYIIFHFQTHAYIILLHRDSIYLAHKYIFFRFRYWCYCTQVFQFSHLNFHFRFQFLVGLSHQLIVGKYCLHLFLSIKFISCRLLTMILKCPDLRIFSTKVIK